MIKPMPGRILVELLPRDEHDNKLGLTIIDQTKHFRHPIRKGRVIAAGPDVKEVKVGEVVVFRGDSGQTTDGREDEEIKNENFQRWLKEHECLAVQEEVA